MGRGLRRAIGFALLVLGPALSASAAPILIASPQVIELSPVQRVVRFDVDPNGTPVSAILLNLSSLASELQILAIASLDTSIGTSGPAPNGAYDEAGFVGSFLTDRSALFTVGTVTLEGFSPGATLVVSGVFMDSSFTEIPIGPIAVVTVVPEPTTASLLATGTLVLAALRRRKR